MKNDSLDSFIVEDDDCSGKKQALLQQEKIEVPNELRPYIHFDSDNVPTSNCAQLMVLCDSKCLKECMIPE